MECKTCKRLVYVGGEEDCSDVGVLVVVDRHQQRREEFLGSVVQQPVAATIVHRAPRRSLSSKRLVVNMLASNGTKKHRRVRFLAGMSSRDLLGRCTPRHAGENECVQSKMCRQSSWLSY